MTDSFAGVVGLELFFAGVLGLFSFRDCSFPGVAGLFFGVVDFG